MKKFSLKLGAAFLAAFFILSYVLPSIQALAHDRHHGEEMVDIVVSYYDQDQVPSEDELDPSFENIRTSESRPIQALTVPASTVRDLMEDQAVRHIHYNEEVTPSESQATLNAQDWNNEMVNAFDAWSEGFTGSGINVAVIDSGFHNDHPDINFTGGASIFDEPWDLDHMGHGTHVAGIIGAAEGTTHQGVSPNVNLYGVKVYHSEEFNEAGTENVTDTYSLAAGIDLARQQFNPDIIVISSGTQTDQPYLKDAIVEASNAGALIIAASGNGKARIDYPAAYPEVISVSSVTQELYPASDIIPSSEGHEGRNELAAPGVSIGGLWNDGGYATRSGSSQAAPHVAGVAALLMQKHGLSASQIRTMMQEDALDLDNFALYGYGLVQYVADESEENETEEDTEESAGSEEPSDSDTAETPNENGSTEEDEGEETTDTPPSETEDTDNENGSESDNDEQTESDSDDEESTDEDEVDEEDEDDLSSAVWIRPSNSNGIATVEDEDLEAIADNGTLAISFDSSINHITHATLTADQVAEIRERNLTVLIAKTEMEWVIPPANFEEGEATLRFQSPDQDLPRLDEASSNAYQFSMSQNGVDRTTFEEEMIYRIFVDNAEENGEILYEWLAEEDAWTGFGNTYGNGAVIGQAPETGTYSVFNPEVFENDDRNIITSERLDGPLVEEDIEADSAGFFGEQGRMILAVAGLAVIGGSVGGGFYYFGKSKS